MKAKKAAKTAVYFVKKDAQTEQFAGINNNCDKNGCDKNNCDKNTF